MATTAVFAEILIIGLVAITAAAAVVAESLGVNLNFVAQYKDWAVAVTLALGAVARPIGIAIDRISDTVAEWFEKPIVRPNLHITESEMRFRVWRDGPSRTVEFLDYARSRRRVARSICLIAVLMATSAADWQLVDRRVDHRMLLVFVGMLLEFAMAWTWWRIGRMYYPRLELAYRVYVLGEPEGAGEGLGG